MSFLNLIKKRLINQPRIHEETVASEPRISSESRQISVSEQKLSSSNTFKFFKNFKQKWKSSFSLRDNSNSSQLNSQSTLPINKKLGKNFLSLRKLHKNGIPKNASIPKLFKKRINKVSKYFFNQHLRFTAKYSVEYTCF